MGAGSLRDLFEEQYYGNLDGGILESFGRLFKNDLKLFVYPLLDRQTNALTTVENLEVAPKLRKLYAYLVESGCIEQLDDFHQEYLLDLLARDPEEDQSRRPDVGVDGAARRRRGDQAAVVLRLPAAELSARSYELQTRVACGRSVGGRLARLGPGTSGPIKGHCAGYRAAAQRAAEPTPHAPVTGLREMRETSLRSAFDGVECHLQ